MTKTDFEKFSGRQISNLDWAKVIEPMWLSSVTDKKTFLQGCGRMVINPDMACVVAEGKVITCIVVIDDRFKIGGSLKADDLKSFPCSMALRVDHKSDDGMRYCELLDCTQIRKGDEPKVMCVFRLSNEVDLECVKETLCDLQGQPLDFPKMFRKVMNGGYVKMDRS